MYRILISEDEVKIAAFMEKGSKKQEFATAVAEDGWNPVLASASPSRLAVATCSCECDHIWRKRHLACPPAN
jgi:DNA-binding response OmpR family regulator